MEAHFARTKYLGFLRKVKLKKAVCGDRILPYACGFLPENKYLSVPFAKLPKATSSFVLSVCPPVRPHETTRSPLGRFSLNLIWEFFENLKRKYFFCQDK